MLTSPDLNNKVDYVVDNQLHSVNLLNITHGRYFILCEILNGTLMNVGISGLNNAGRTSNSIRRFIWVVIFVVGVAFTLYSTIVVVLDMLQYPVDTTVTRTKQDYVQI